MKDKVTVRNIHTGQVGVIRRRIFENPVINKGVLEEVDENAKSYLPGHYTSRLNLPEPEEAKEPVPSEPVSEKPTKPKDK